MNDVFVDAMRTDASVVLPLATPSVDCYPQHAYHLSVMELQPESRGWLYTNYIHLSAFPAPETGEMFFFDFFVPDVEKHFNPWLSVQKIHRDSFGLLCADPVEAFRGFIRSGEYIKAPLDEFHVPGSDAQGRVHYPHPSLLHGFDDRSERFHFCGYLGARYERSSIGYDDLRRAWAGLRDCGPPDYPHLFLVRPHCHWPFPFDPAAVRDALEEYLASRNPMLRVRHMLSPVAAEYGVAAQAAFDDYARAVAAGQAKSNVLPSHLLYEHKRMMARRIEDMIARGAIAARDFAERAATLEALGFKLRAEYLKLHRRSGPRSADLVLKLSEKLRIHERALLTETIRALETAE